jgi:hypothetical protein
VAFFGRSPLYRSNASPVPRLFVKDSDRTLVCGFRIIVGIAHGCESCPSELAQGAHHVKHHSCLAGLIEMQVVPHNNVEQIVWSKRPISRRLDVIAGYEKFLLTVRSGEDASLRIISSIGKKLQSQKWMSRAAFS